MRLDLRDLQATYDTRWPFPLYLLRYKTREPLVGRRVVRYWNAAPGDDVIETLAYAEVAQ